MYNIFNTSLQLSSSSHTVETESKCNNLIGDAKNNNDNNK